MKTNQYARERIIFFRNEKHSLRKIRSSLANEGFAVSLKTIHRIVRKFQREHSIVERKRTGRRTKLNEEQVEAVAKRISEDREVTVYDLIRFVGKSFSVFISKDTIYRAAKSQNWSRKGTRYCQIVSESNLR